MAVPKKPRVLNENTEVTVINNTSGTLYYRSPRTQDEYEWGVYGDEHEMPIHELKTMKSQHRRFLDDNWIIFAEKDYDVIPYLKLEKQYKTIVTPEQIEELFEKAPSDLVDAINNASLNVKDLIFAKAREKFNVGELRDIHMIEAVEKTLGVEIDPSRNI